MYKNKKVCGLDMCVQCEYDVFEEYKKIPKAEYIKAIVCFAIGMAIVVGLLIITEGK